MESWFVKRPKAVDNPKSSSSDRNESAHNFATFDDTSIDQSQATENAGASGSSSNDQNESSTNIDNSGDSSQRKSNEGGKMIFLIEWNESILKFFVYVQQLNTVNT